MPQAAAAAASFISQYVGTALATAGIGGTIGYAVTLTAYYGAYAGTTLAISAAVTAATTPDPPKPEAGQFNSKQSVPPRQRGYGVCRRSGAFMLNEASQNVLHQVFAINDGRVEGFDRFWLHDDEVTLVGDAVQQLPDGAFETGRVRIEYRLGEATETAYAGPIADLPSGVWTSNHRGDGIASLHMKCQNGKLADYPKQFPNGVPVVTSEVRHLAYDWRDGTQDRLDPTTWKLSRNPVVCLVHERWAHRGLDWDARIAPGLADLTAEADYCDEAVALKGGGTEPRYACGGFFDAITEPAGVYAKLIEAMDGWMTFGGDGRLIVKAGRYDAPTVTFGDDVIVDYNLQRYVEGENAVNQLLVSYTSPEHAYSTVDVTPWRDEAAILALGEEKDESFNPSWVQANGQGRRLAKRRMSRLGAELRGTITTNLAGLRGLGERYIRIQSSDLASLNDLVIEVGKVEVDIKALRVTFEFIAADPNIDAWNPATEEGDGPSVEGRVAGEALAQPTFDGAPVAFFADTGTGGQGVRIRATVLGPARDDLSWSIRWRQAGGSAWVEGPAQDVDTGADIVLETGFVPADANVEVEVAYTTGGGVLSPWSDPETVSTSTAAVAPAAPTNLGSSSPGAGQATVSWRNPTSGNFDRAKIYRGTTTVFGAATLQATRSAAPGSNDSLAQSGLAAGTYRYWVVAENASGAASAPVGPTTVTVT